MHAHAAAARFCTAPCDSHAPRASPTDRARRAHGRLAARARCCGGQLVRQVLARAAAVTSMISDTHYWTWVALVTFQLVDHYIIRADDDSAYLKSEGYQAATKQD